MASKEQERRYLDKALRDLVWTGIEVLPGDEPPDFYLVTTQSRRAVEVTRVHAREGRKGSPDKAEEQERSRFVSDLETEYFAAADAQSIQVTVSFPPTIRSRSVRKFSSAERRADATRVAKEALDALGSLPALNAWNHRTLYVQQRDGRRLSLRVLRLQDPLRLGWNVMTNLAGWEATIDARALQERINAKAADLPKYRHDVAAAFLLVVADGSTASGFLELRSDAVVDAAGFDAVFFQRYPFDDTRPIAGRGRA